MKISGKDIRRIYTPLFVSGNLVISGGAAVQFFDGNYYYPNREGSPASPILITHELSAVDPDGILTKFDFTTKFYENDSLITSSTAKYELVGDHVLKVMKNIPAGTSAVIKAVSELLDTRTGKIYTRTDVTYLRTILKTEAPYQLELSPRGAIFFDAYRNPNTTETITALLRRDGEVITNFTGITFKWLNRDGVDVVDNELYGDKYSNGNRTLQIDKKYIDNETIKCEAWKDGEMIAFDTVTFTRRFNSFRSEIRTPELPLAPGVNNLNCTLLMYDHLGEIDVDAAFLVTWIINENGSEREVATGSVASIPVSSVNMNAATLQIYPDVKRREAWAALVDSDDYLLTDSDGAVLTVETYGI